MDRLNVLVYSGDGTTPTTVLHAYETLHALLTPLYALSRVSAATLINEPWSASTALLVLPGGADLGYCRALSGSGNQRIREYIYRGGKILGICAGGYFCGQRCEFEVGDKYEVIGARELGLFKGIVRGAAFHGFAGGSEEGARASSIKPVDGTSFKSYYNGGGIFVDAANVDNVEVLAEFEDDVKVEGGNAAVIYVPYGDGAALLSEAHLEFAPALLRKDNPHPSRSYAKLIEDVADDSPARLGFMKRCLQRLGLKVNDSKSDAVDALEIEKIHLSSPDASAIHNIIHSMAQDYEPEPTMEGRKLIAEKDVFIIEPVYAAPAAIQISATGTEHGQETAPGLQRSSFKLPYAEQSAAPYHILPHIAPPKLEYTPTFDHPAFFSALGCTTIGRVLLYTPLIPSTNTLVDANYKFLKHLPSGTTIVADAQSAGRGRSGNSWVTADGCLVFTFVLTHDMSKVHAPVVLVQYLAALAIVRATKTYKAGWQNIPIKIKWPNDVYVEDGIDEATGKPAMKKLSGILVTSSYCPSPPSFLLTTGIGINLSNKHPTTSIAELLDSPSLASKIRPENRTFTRETYLAHFMKTFQSLHSQFMSGGWRAVEKMYYENWMHSGALVKLEAEGGKQVIVEGVSGETGCLIVRESGGSRTFEVRGDGNSFDFMRGLIRRKA